MPTKQKVVLLVLVILSLVQQGARWIKHNQEPGVVTAVAQAAEPASSEQTDKHCALVHVNSAGLAELQTLPGIGPVYAERIIVERREEPFREKHHLLRVAGIGEKRLAQMAHLICLYFHEHAAAQ